MPGTPTLEERRERLDYAAFLLSRRLYKSDIKKLMARRFQGMRPRTVEKYLKKARERLRLNAHLTEAGCRVRSLAFWDSVVRGTDSRLCDRMAAQERLDWLLG